MGSEMCIRDSVNAMLWVDAAASMWLSREQAAGSLAAVDVAGSLATLAAVEQAAGRRLLCRSEEVSLAPTQTLGPSNFGTGPKDRQRTLATHATHVPRG